MENENVKIVKECIEQVHNGRHFERLYDYYDEGCTFYSPPYVGLGIMTDDSSGERVVVKTVAPGGPAAGKLQAGDVLLGAKDASGAWEGYEQLRTALWGQGKLGTEVTLTLLREGVTVEVTLARGRVEGFNGTIAQFRDSWQHSLETEMPDLHTEINLIFSSGDLVAYFATNTGTNLLYGQSAIWPDCNILRLKEGKIVEWYGVEDTLTLWRQLGFKIAEPARVAA